LPSRGSAEVDRSTPIRSSPVSRLLPVVRPSPRSGEAARTGPGPPSRRSRMTSPPRTEVRCGWQPPCGGQPVPLGGWAPPRGDPPDAEALDGVDAGLPAPSARFPGCWSRGISCRTLGAFTPGARGNVGHPPTCGNPRDSFVFAPCDGFSRRRVAWIALALGMCHSAPVQSPHGHRRGLAHPCRHPRW
jgi:hypothetical protein